MFIEALLLLCIEPESTNALDFDEKNKYKLFGKSGALLWQQRFDQLYEKIVRLKLEALDKKMRETDTANTEAILDLVGKKTPKNFGVLKGKIKTAKDFDAPLPDTVLEEFES